MSKRSILGGASFQSVLLQSHQSQIENIGIAIYQMQKYYAGWYYFVVFFIFCWSDPFLVDGNSEDVIEYFLNRINRKKDELKVCFIFLSALILVTETIGDNF